MKMLITSFVMFFAIIFLSLSTMMVIDAKSTVWPQPKSIEYKSNEFIVTPGSFSFNVVGNASHELNNAIKRYTTLIFRSINNQLSGQNIFQGFVNLAAPAPSMLGLDIKVLSADTSLEIGVDDTYSLNTAAAPRATLIANTVYGAIRGLETFSQLIDHNFYLTGAVINDEARFKYRGFLLDTARHFLPLNVIYQHLDAMAYNKYNVLHWHIVDDTSFPYQSTTFPELSAQGAFSQRHVYTYDDIQAIQKYAKDRGIVVIPEFDTPGHVTRGYEALVPKILTDCYKEGKFTKTGPLNPTLDATYTFLGKLYDELKDVFWSKYAHVGGDEVIHSCWNSNPQIKSWMALHPEIADANDLEQYFVRNLLDILGKRGFSYIVWEEIFTNGGKIQPDTIIEVWKEEGWQEVMKQVHARGFKSVLSANFYINFISYGADWKKYYMVEPTDFEGGEEAEKSILGLETALWAEYVDSTNLLSRSWPRASAIGERMWSQKSVRNVEEAQLRLQEFRCKLVRRGIPAQPSENGALFTAPAPPPFCFDEYNVGYVPLF